MFIDNIRHQDIQTINLLDTNTNTKKKENENFINHLKILFALKYLAGIIKEHSFPLCKILQTIYLNN